MDKKKLVKNKNKNFGGDGIGATANVEETGSQLNQFPVRIRHDNKLVLTRGCESTCVP